MKKNISNFKKVLVLLFVCLFLTACANTLLVPSATLPKKEISVKPFNEASLEISELTIPVDNILPKMDALMDSKSKQISEPVIQTRAIDVCSTSGVKSYMDVNMINEISRQYEIISTETEVGQDGILYTEDGYMGIALGSYFGELGKKFIFTLDTGLTLKVIKVEAKDDKDTINGCQHKTDGSVIEFVVDNSLAAQYWGIAENGYILSGNFNNNDYFKGEIVSIEEVVE